MPEPRIWPKLSVRDLEEALVNEKRRVTQERQRADALYVRLRSLEAAVRNTVVVGERTDSDALYRLRSRIPAKPRPTLRALRDSYYTRIKAARP